MQLKARSNGNFSNQLKERIQKWAAIPKQVAATIVVPPELSWWYFQEFGVPHGYTIPARTGGKIAYPTHGGQVVADSVDHTLDDGSGLKPRRMVSSVLPEIKQDVKESIHEYLGNGGSANPAGLELVLLESLGRAKDLITESFAQQLPSPPRPAPDPRFIETQSGKLHGATAAEAYSALAKVINTSR